MLFNFVFIMFIYTYNIIILILLNYVLLINASPTLEDTETGLEHIERNQRNKSDLKSLEDSWVPRVINGHQAKLGDFPYQVALKSLVSRHTGIYTTFCGATIIAPTKLLSAAHCFDEKKFSCAKLMNPNRVSSNFLVGKYAVAGSLYNALKYSSNDANGQWRKIHSVHLPKNFKFPIDDIAVMYLKTPFVYNRYVSPIPIAVRQIDYRGSCKVSGYGRTGYNKYEKAEVLLYADLKIMSMWECNRAHRMNMKNFVCTSSIINDVGKGDSGGPLVCFNSGDPNDYGKGVLVGVVSGHRHYVGSFFTRVSSYQKFIATSNANYILLHRISILLCLVRVINWSVLF